MSPDSKEIEGKSRVRVISKPRIIAGLLAEMEATQAAATAICIQSGKIFCTTIKCTFTVPFDTSFIQLQNETISSGHFSVETFFAGHRVQFEVTVSGDTRTCSFPKEVILTDNRRAKRRAFSADVQVAEIATTRSMVLATPVDISQRSMALVSADSMPALKEGESVHVVVRGGPSARDVFASQMIVQSIRMSDSQSRILLTFDTPNARPAASEQRSVRRRFVEGLTTSVAPSDSGLGEKNIVRISEISLTGFSGELIDELKGAWICPGVHVLLQDGKVSATVMWRHDKRFGMRLDALDESNTLNNWFNMLLRMCGSYSVHHSQIEDLVNLFTQSGLLKGERRKIYGINPGKFLPPEIVTNNPLLYHRIASLLRNGNIAGQVSMARLTDNYWFLQEGAHSGDESADSYSQLLNKAIDLARELSLSTSLAPKYIGGIVHSSVKSSASILDEKLKFQRNRKYEAFHVKMSSLFDPSKSSTEKSIIVQISELDASSRRSLANAFDSTLFDAFGGWDGSHPRLNAELSKLGPAHEASTFAIESEGRYMALGFRLRSYYSLSATGVINSAFLIVQTDTSPEALDSAISSIQNMPILRGTDDLIIVYNEPVGKTDGIVIAGRDHATLVGSRAKTKPFNLYVIDAASAV